MAASVGTIAPPQTPQRHRIARLDSTRTRARQWGQGDRPGKRDLRSHDRRARGGNERKLPLCYRLVYLWADEVEAISVSLPVDHHHAPHLRRGCVHVEE